MICTRCGQPISGETAHIGEPMCAANGYDEDYILLLTCKVCSATHSIRMWQSEEAAIEDWLQDERELSGISSILSDAAYVTNSDRDAREVA